MLNSLRFWRLFAGSMGELINMSIIIPPKKPVPEGATQELRQKMYQEYCEELRLWNPFYFHSDGTFRKWWEILFGIKR